MDSVRSPLAYPPVAKETISSERAAYVHISMTAPKAKHVAILFTLISQRVGHNTGDASDPLYAGTARARASSLRTGSRSCVSCNARGGSWVSDGESLTKYESAPGASSKKFWRPRVLGLARTALALAAIGIKPHGLYPPGRPGTGGLYAPANPWTG